MFLLLFVVSISSGHVMILAVISDSFLLISHNSNLQLPTLFPIGLRLCWPCFSFSHSINLLRCQICKHACALYRMQSTKRRPYFLYVPTLPHHLYSKSVHGLLVLEFVSQFHASATVWCYFSHFFAEHRKRWPSKGWSPLSIHKLDRNNYDDGALASNFGLGVKNEKTDVASVADSYQIEWDQCLIL